ncbi:HAD family hydrolase [uncultured Cohaesibacter sp.]|uniref:HAD family hydrolase n=1 Tax=uncultured Cohaesibacter sp. TaxID=1002546 RepID=UPI00292E62BC|nr:HAD family hydrolase [uncultured Cohaesibacter sp.]
MTSIFFDLDGTLTDPKTGIVGSVQYALNKLGIDDIPEDLDWVIGPPLQESAAKLAGDARKDELVAAYRERYSRDGLFENSVYNGIPDMLEELQKAGNALFVATSKPHPFANQILEHFDLSRYFVKVFGAELDGTRSNKAELLAHALDVSGSDARSSIMVGDRKHDILGAKANGMKSVGVLWGYGGEDELREAGADEIASIIGSLPSLFSSM